MELRRNKSVVPILAIVLSVMALAGCSVSAEVNRDPMPIREELYTPTLPIITERESVPIVESIAGTTIDPTTDQSWYINVTAFGFQDEIDACNWTHMDLIAAVAIPIIGAHNYCGGDIVLGMSIGDTVTLSGFGFDGVYTVVESRDANMGDYIPNAISGMVSDVVLQTCYWTTDGAERLVGLVRN